MQGHRHSGYYPVSRGDIEAQPWIVIFARNLTTLLGLVAPLKSVALKRTREHQSISIHHLHLLPTMLYHILTTLLSLASIASAIPTLYLVGCATMADWSDKNVTHGYVVPMRPFFNQ